MPNPTATLVISELAQLADPERAKSNAWFFKTGEGQYGAGDLFIGVRVPDQRRVALRFRNLPLSEIETLLASPVHEHRFTALEILVAQFEKGTEAIRKGVFDFYLQHTAQINNWDLVDTSAPYIVGEHLLERPRKILDKLAKSQHLWERRIAIVATFAFLRAGETETTYRISQMLLSDKHDLIHKAVGWALRESGKVSEDALLAFLETHYASLPRTTLRYAIERFPRERRARLLRGDFTP